MNHQSTHDVIIIGGSYAGLSAALSLGRSLRQVLVIDSGLPCNRQTPHSHNFLTQDGEKPGAIAAKAREQLYSYKTVRVVNGLAVSAEKTGDGFTVTTNTGQAFASKKIILATGIRDIMPPVKGFEVCWGISVVHCPYCHGYELRGLKTGILANGDKAFHIASLVNNLTDDITVLTSGKATFHPEQLEKLADHKIDIVETEVSEIDHRDGQVRHVVFADGTHLPFEAVYAALPFEQHSAIPSALGCELNEHGYIRVDEFQMTTIGGVYACGDNSSTMRSVANAVYTGNLAGAMVNRALTEERF